MDPDTVVEAVELADKLVKRVGKSSAQVANNAAPVTLPTVKTKVVSFSPYLKKTRWEAVSVKVKSDALRAVAELVTEAHNVPLSKLRDERQDKAEAWMATKPRRKATLAKVCDETSG